jgi:hypothetical protein
LEQGRGLRITTEAYPYGAGSTVVGAEIFRGNWRERFGGATSGDIELAGVPLTDETLADAQARTPGAWIVAHFMRPDRSALDQSLLDQSVLMPGGAIASDAMPWTLHGQPITGDVWPLPADAFSHPRSAGTFTRFLRDYVRTVGDGPIYTDEGQSLWRIESDHSETLTAEGTLALYRDRLALGSFSVPLYKINQISVYGSSAVVFSAEGFNYEIKSDNSRSGRKYQTMVEILTDGMTPGSRTAI